MEKHKLCILVILVVYIAAASYGMLSYTAIWDEGGHNYVLFFVYDMIRENPGLLFHFNALKSYALDYNLHYSFYSSMFYHPPLYKIFVLPFFFLLGPGIVALRLPTLILGIIGVLVAYRFAMEISGSRWVSIIAVFLFSMSHVYLQWSSFGNIDVALTVFVLISMYFFVRYEKTGRANYLYLFGVFTGLSYLLKLSGISNIIIVVLYMAFTGRLRRLFSRDFLITYAIIFLISLPWMVAYSLRPYESISTIKSFLLQGNIFSLEYWPKVLFNLIYFVSLPGIILLAAKRPMKFPYRKLFVIWTAVYFIAFVFVYDYAEGFPRLFLPALFPVVMIISYSLTGVKRKYMYLFVVIFVLQSVFFGIAYNYVPPTEKAVNYVMENSPAGSGIVITNANQQFYIMSKDRNREYFSLWFSKDINTTLEAIRKKKNYTGSINISYIIVDTQVTRKDEMEYIENNFVLEKSYEWTHVFPDIQFMYSRNNRTDGVLMYKITS